MSQILKYIFLAFLVALVIIGCDQLTIKSGKQQFPTIESLPTPPLPEWIAQITPTGDTNPSAQILIRFKSPLIPLQSLDNPDQAQLLQKFEILPPLPGTFRFLTPRLVAFQVDQPLPKATRFQVTLKSGLADLENHRLEKDLAWTFQTEAIAITELPNSNKEPGQPPEVIAIKPTLNFTSNVELDLASLSEKLTITPEGQNNKTAVKIALKQPQEADQWVYTITPENPLAKATLYRLEIAPGLRPLQGNLATEKSFTSTVNTYSPLAFNRLEFYGKTEAGVGYGRFVEGAPQLRFNNPLVADSATNNITLNPQPKSEVKLLEIYDGSDLILLNSWALEPNTKYTLTLGANLKDQFNQTLGKPTTVEFTTSDVSPDIWAPSGLNIFPADTNLQLNISTVNLPEKAYQAAYRKVKPTELVYRESADPTNQPPDLLPKSVKWSKYPVTGAKNQNLENVVNLKEKLGAATGMLAYGVKAKTNLYEQEGKQTWRIPEFYGLIQLTNLGIFAQWFSDSGIVRVNHLSDGSPVNNATIEIYQSKLYPTPTAYPTPTPCAVVTTDATGSVTLKGETWQQCLKKGSEPELLVIAKEGEDWAFTRTQPYSGSYGYGIDTGWDDGKPQSRGVIFSDRQLYQPGETVYLTGVAYYLQQGKLKQDRNTTYTITLNTPDGKQQNLGNKTTNDFGTLSWELPLAKNQPLGSYSLIAKSKGDVEIVGEFNVAEFNPPNFQVNLTLGQKFATPGQKVTAKAEGKYLFGAPVEGGKVSYFVTRQKTDFIPPGWENYTFGPQWLWPENPPEVPSDVLQSHQVLDSNGQVKQEIAVADDLPYPMTYRVETQVTDVSNLSTSNTQSFVALTSDRLIGLQNDFVADANKPFPVKVILSDPTGKAIAGEKIRIELQEIKYSSVTQVKEGSATEKDQVEYKTTQQQEITSTDQPQTVTLTAPTSGSYRLKANLASSKSDSTASHSQIWVTGQGVVNWGSRYENKRLDIQLDKPSYTLGETATALIQSPYPEAELYFAVIKNNIIYQQVTQVTGSAPKISFQVTEEMLPNAAVQAVLVRRGQPLKDIDTTAIDRLARVGFAPFNTGVAEKYLNLQLKPQTDKVKPNTEQIVDITLTDIQNKPLKGQVTVMVVNEAILQLTGYRVPDLVKTVYADQYINTRFSDNRADVVLASLSSPLEKGWGFGGGLSQAAANTRLRTNFQPIAYYQGSVITDAQGKASVTFKLPDNLTTWRVMAVATDGNWRFAKGDTSFVATQPLISNPILPTFARVGDRFFGGLSITNNTGNPGNLLVNGSASGSVELTGDARLQTQATNATSGYRFPMIANKPGVSKIQFVSELNNQKDAFEVPLEVRDLEVTEQVVETGVTSDQVKITLNVDNKVAPDRCGLDILLANTLIPAITAPAKETQQQQELPFLEPVASNLLIAANLTIINKKLGVAVDKLEAQQAIENLQKLQQLDGGFAAIPNQQRSDPFLTAYAAFSIAQARRADLQVNSAMVSFMQGYLNNILNDPTQYDYCKNSTCQAKLRLEILIALGELGDKRQDFLQSIYNESKNFDFLTQIKLAKYLQQFTAWKTQVQALSTKIQENIAQTGRQAIVNLPQNLQFFSSDTTIQAQALSLFIEQKANPELIDRLLQGLLSLRRSGTWQNSYNNAQALTAIVNYLQLQPTPPNFTATVQLANQEVGKADFQGYRQSSFELNIPMAKLPRGNNEIILKKSGTGQLHYLTSYSYRLQGNPPGRINGLRVIRYVRPAATESILGKMDLYAPDQPLTLPVARVYEVTLEIISDHPVDHLVISDPLPAGLEAVNTNFQTSGNYPPTENTAWQVDYQNTYKDKVVAYSDRLEAGVYQFKYLVRSVTPGTFSWPGAHVYLQYTPEEFGRTAATVLVLEEPKPKQ